MRPSDDYVRMLDQVTDSLPVIGPGDPVQLTFLAPGWSQPLRRLRWMVHHRAWRRATIRSTVKAVVHDSVDLGVLPAWGTLVEVKIEAREARP